MGLQRARRTGGDGGGDFRVEAQSADGFDEDVAVGMEVADQRLEGRFDLAGPASSQGRARFSRAFDCTAQVPSLSVSRLEDLCPLLRRPRPVVDGAGVHLVEVRGVGGQMQARPERLRNHPNRGLQALHGLGGAAA